VGAYIATFLAPLAAASASAFGGGDARDAALLFGGAHITRTCLAQVAACAAAAAEDEASWRARAADAAEQLAALSPDAASGVAWQRFLITGLPLDRWLLDASERLQSEEARCPARARRACDAEFSPGEAAWIEELRRGRHASLELVNHLQSLVAQVKLASLGTCLQVACAVAELMSGHARGVAAHLAARAAWVRRLVAQSGEEEGRSHPLFTCGGGAFACVRVEPRTMEI
jgi:hypothetical protein